MNPVNWWIDRGSERVYLQGLYQTSAGGLVVLDWEQQTVENRESQGGMNRIACICGSFPAAFGASRSWHMRGCYCSVRFVQDVITVRLLTGTENVPSVDRSWINLI